MIYFYLLQGKWSQTAEICDIARVMDQDGKAKL